MFTLTEELQKLLERRIRERDEEIAQKATIGKKAGRSLRCVLWGSEYFFPRSQLYTAIIKCDPSREVLEANGPELIIMGTFGSWELAATHAKKSMMKLPPETCQMALVLRPPGMMLALARLAPREEWLHLATCSEVSR